MGDKPKKKILVLEDHATLRSMMTELFQLAGYQVTAVINGRQGLERAQEGGYDAIISDIKMPQMDGIQFLRAYQNSPSKSKNGPVIMYSNFAYEFSKNEVLGLGAVEFIAKDTISTGEFLDKVESIVQNYTQKQASDSKEESP